MRLGLVYVHRDVDQFQQLHHPWNVVAKDLAAGMILMRVGDEHLGDGVAVLLGRLHNALNLPGWINYCRLARYRVANEIDVVLHRSAFHLLQVECVCHTSRSRTAYRQRCLTISLYVTHYTVFSMPCLPRT